ERVSYAYADVQRVVVVDDIVSAIDNVVANDKRQHVVFSFSASTLNVSGLPANESIALYATDGKLMLSDKANAEGKAAMNLSSLQQGIYVVRTQSGISYKLFKK
ncbi:T9SS type A sorting domain-containing protein, partial [uncultured Eubacterium sp.]|uniref:T9SS type A sorting domain-containing protein n=1 Tax=uncultured Eubacterium sp. TaxID=165185 RepID=UPI0025944CEA